MFKVTNILIERLVLTDNPVQEQDYRPIMESIESVGLQYPLLVVANEDGYYHIVDGRTRYKALKQLNWKEIPCIVVNNDPEILALTVEVYRRHLPKELVEQYNRKISQLAYENLINQLNAIKSALPEETYKELENYAKENVFKAKSEVEKIYNAINSLDVKTIEHYLFSTSKLAKEKEIISKRAMELEQQAQQFRMKLEQAIAERNRLREEYENLRKAMKNNIESLVERRLQEVLSTMESESQEKYEKLKQKIQDEIEEKYKSELQEYIRQIQDQSNAIKRLMQEKEKLQENFEAERRHNRDISLYVEKIKDEYITKENIIRKALSPNGVLRKIEKAEEYLLDADKEILSTIDYISLLSESSLSVNEANLLSAIENLSNTLTQVKKTIGELEKTVNHYLKQPGILKGNGSNNRIESYVLEESHE